MDIRQGIIQKILTTNGSVIHEHVQKTPSHVLLHYGHELISCSIDNILNTFEQTNARDAMLDQMAKKKEDEAVVACYAENDFLSYVVQLRKK